MLLLERFNHCSREGCGRGSSRMLGHRPVGQPAVGERPFPTVDALLTAAKIAAPAFTEDELEGALSHHPTHRDRVQGSTTEAVHSRAEQAGIGLTHTTLDALAEGKSPPTRRSSIASFSSARPDAAPKRSSRC